MEEISKQNIEGAVCLLSTTYSKMKEERNYLKTEFIIKREAAEQKDLEKLQPVHVQSEKAF